MTRDPTGERRRSALRGLADLVYLRDAGLLAQSAGFLNYEYVPPEPAEPPQRPFGAGAPAPVETAPAPAPEQPAPPALLWRVVAYESFGSGLEDQPSVDDGKPEDSSPQLEPYSPPPKIPLGAPARLLPSLRRAATRLRPTASPDMPRLLRLIERVEVFAALPRKRRRRWGGELWVISDHAERLNPYYEDYSDLYFAVSRLFPEDGVRWSRWRGGAGDPVPPPGGVVLAFTDLGAFAPSDDEELPPESMQAWLRYGRRLRAAGCRAVAVLPGTPRYSHYRDVLAPFWQTIFFAPPPDQAVFEGWDDTVTLLKALAAPAIRVEPGLLRGLRLLLGAKADPAMEADFWQAKEIWSGHIAAASFYPEGRKHLLELFDALPIGQREAALEIIRSWRAPDVWPDGRPLGVSTVHLEEMSSLDPKKSQGLIPKEMRAAFDRAVVELEALPKGDARWREDILSWMRRFSRRMPDAGWRSVRGPAREALDRLWQAAHDEQDRDAPPPPGYVPPPSGPRRGLVIRQRGDRLFAGLAREALSQGSSLIAISSGTDELAVESIDDFWKLGAPPAFAERWGRDAIGPWLEFSLAGAFGPVVQRMRWIGPGGFKMGSPKKEAGRYDDESPRHQVTIGAGFWLAETPSTQALWTAVMGENPSRFQDPERPVERVSWEDAREFLRRINERLPGLSLGLPSEAQWEYACRAGTQGSTYLGDVEILGENNAPGLDAIAWYGGNSGKDFDLQEGQDSSGWPEKQYAHSKAGTRKARRKKPNAWGLYDMLGNVWEWVEDPWHDNYVGAPNDGSAWRDEEAAGRVLRGGSWDFGARDVRSAYRHWYAPDARDGDIGFRCARVQDQAEPMETRRVERSGAKPTAAAPSGGADRARIFVGADGAEIFPRPGSFVISSDCERVTVEPLNLPSWAKAIGRDRFGLWTRIEVASAHGAATQKLRWINPGRFPMGSPEKEAGRFESESPQHEVMIGRGFWVFDTACTQALWTAVMGKNPSRFEGVDRPVDSVSWNDARKFIAQINAKIAGLDLVLPSEAQWEYACRAGTTTPFSFGESITTDQVNYTGAFEYGGERKGHYSQETVPVGSLPANPWGLFEMHGNVLEWCADAWHENYESAPSDGTVWDEKGAAGRVLRGGSWGSGARFVRSACRFRDAPDGRFESFGFRCARVQE